MLFTNTTYGNSFAKDPAVVHFRGKYFLYHTVRHSKTVIGVGIAVSDNGEDFTVSGELDFILPCEQNGIGAPGAIVIGEKLHLFYQTYGNHEHDAVCHAVSDDGFSFERLGIVFAPTGDWNCGRAIDADVCIIGDRLMLYCATRDKSFVSQMVLAASAPLDSGFSADDFRQESVSEPLLEPKLDWEGKCIEAPATIVHNGKVYMFYGGSYNCTPQQIGVAVSDDGINFTRLSDKPFLTCGNPGDWNAYESGHPYVFKDTDGSVWLYYQGSPDRGKSWFISRVRIDFIESKPVLYSGIK